MQRTSDSIATLAAAFAKAQIELVNPEKSLVATIRAERPGRGEQSFLYAPLSSGLDIVRKILGQHEIATVQTTSIDQAAGIVNLTTVLAHASGQWIASDWPVCPISETATPQRMGAALIYARRYALFTLVGIAGEDDLDAPDLTTPTAPTSGLERSKASGNGQLNGDRNARRSHRRIAPQTTTAILGPEASAALREHLIDQLNDLGSTDDAAIWARQSLAEKNRLIAADALRVEELFDEKLKSFAVDGDTAILEPAEPQKPGNRYVAQHPCLICGRQPADAHHLRVAQCGALGRKVSDEFTVPLCRGHHREVHHCGNEAAWWRKAGVDPMVAARDLWLETRPSLTSPVNLLVDPNSVQPPA